MFTSVILQTECDSYNSSVFTVIGIALCLQNDRCKRRSPFFLSTDYKEILILFGDYSTYQDLKIMILKLES